MLVVLEAARRMKAGGRTVLKAWALTSPVSWEREEWACSREMVSSSSSVLLDTGNLLTRVSILVQPPLKAGYIRIGYVEECDGSKVFSILSWKSVSSNTVVSGITHGRVHLDFVTNRNKNTDPCLPGRVRTLLLLPRPREVKRSPEPTAGLASLPGPPLVLDSCRVHPGLETLPQPAGGTPVPSGLVHQAVSASSWGTGSVLGL